MFCFCINLLCSDVCCIIPENFFMYIQYFFFCDYASPFFKFNNSSFLNEVKCSVIRRTFFFAFIIFDEYTI